MFPQYTDRKEEVSYFLKVLTFFEEINFVGSNKELINFEIDSYNFEDFFKILRSNFILLLYNFIESSIFLFIQKIYEKFEDENITYMQASSLFQKLFIEYTFSDTFKKDSSYKTYKNKTFEIIEYILENQKLEFRIEKLSDLSGNIGSENLRRIFRKHGINFKSKSKSQDLNNVVSIDNIKNERNALAHGRKSFLETGSNYTVNDLKNYYNEIVILMDDILKSVNQFIKNKDYKNNC